MAVDVMRIRDATQDPKLKSELGSATDSWRQQMKVVADDKEAVRSHGELLSLTLAQATLWLLCFVAYGVFGLVYLIRRRRAAAVELANEQ
ncbi:hypothetical protein [Xanthomonas arboricola]|uniref:MFS transporter n=1 Tax=Xanthomonas arboricola TaxID=56448 RepID=A0AB73H3B7_9XANT|nr:hypothetical protein [Xanthomonas arboricola]MBB5672478.1 hypothetical protein [Xanthomonas arboricola]